MSSADVDGDGSLVVALDEVVEGGGDLENQVELTKEDNAVIDVTVNFLAPICYRFGFGGFVGFCSGYALKSAAKVVTLTLGVGFACLQSLQYGGYIDIKWGKIKQDLVDTFDSDGSGTLGVKDIRHHVTKLFTILRFKGPPAAGFSTGLYLGFKEG